MSEGTGASTVTAATHHNIRRIFAQTVTRLRAEQALAEAEFFARSHLTFLQDELGHEDGALEIPLANLAELLSAQGKLVAARAFVRRLTDLRVALYGATHPSVAQAQRAQSHLDGRSERIEASK